MNNPLRDRVKSSVSVSMGATVIAGIIQLATMVVLARLLHPADYGYFVVALSINALSAQFLASAIERAMVVEADVARLNGRALPTMLLLLAVAIFVLALVAITRQVTGWDVDLRVTALILLSGTIGGLGVAPRALLRREMRFTPIAASEVSGLFFGNLLTAATLAWLGFGAFALAGAVVVQACITAGWMLCLAPPGMLKPRFRDLGELPKTFRGVTKSAGLEAVNGQVSPIVVSSILGPVSLGLFNRVYNITTLPIQLLVSSLSRVIISTLVAVADDVGRRRRATGMMIRSASAIITPVAFGLAGSSHSFRAVVLGERWVGAEAIVPFLSLAVWANMLASLLAQLADATRKFNQKARIQLTATISLVVLLLLGGTIWGLMGVAAGAALAAVIFLGLYLRLTASILDLPYSKLITWLTPGFVAGLACFLTARIIALAMEGKMPALQLSTQIAACGLVAAIMLILLDRTTLLDFARLLLPTSVNSLVHRFLGQSQTH